MIARVISVLYHKDLIKEADSLFYYFIWNGKDKVKRNVMKSEVEKGGINMLGIDSMVRTRRTICIKKIIWKTVKVRGKLL